MNALLKTSDILAAQTLADPRWTVVQARDRAADGTFVYAVKTTGVFCRPSCAARPARPENVAFFATSAGAEDAGFRPCKRCKPTEADADAARAATIAATCRTIESADEPPTLAALAKVAGMSPHHFHRIFKAQTGVTPRAYAAMHRARRVREGLQTGRSVTEAIYDAGYNSGSRFYEQAGALLGMTPSKFKAGGADTTIHFAVGQCSLGAVLVATTPKGVCAITIGDDPDALLQDLQERFPGATLIGGDEHFEAVVSKVVGLVERPGTGLGLPLDVRGTAFQRRVWEVLQTIPAGATASYSEVAERIGAPRAVRAVASACANNAIAIAIPCHRVVRKGGEISGGNYRWGIARKRALLAREARA